MSTAPRPLRARRRGAGHAAPPLPTKGALFGAVVGAGLAAHVAAAEAAAEATDAGAALFAVLGRMLDDGTRSQALEDALTEEGFDLRGVAPEALDRLHAALAVLLARAQQQRSVRRDVEVADVLALLAGAFAAQRLRPGVGGVLLDALRPR